jgi:molecular chaperone DnaK
MAAESTVDAFLAVLRQSKLIVEDRLDALLQQAGEQGVPLDTPQAIASALLHSRALTRWQAKRLLAGKKKGFWLGDYRLLDLLGEGAMGSVYLAEHAVLRRKSAVKVLPAARAKDGSFLPRFLREARLAAALDHPNIVRAYDVDRAVVGDGEIYYLAMEYVKGINVQTTIDRGGPLPVPKAVDIARQAAEGLEHAHQAGLIHRDIKPANLLLDERGVLKILDLGLAKSSREDEEASITLAHDEKVLGTANFLSPEQARNSHTVDHRTDIYSLGCTLYCMLTGHPPFDKGSAAERIAAHQHSEPRPLTQLRPEAPADLARLVERMMAKDPAQRFQAAGQLAQQLDAWLARHKSPLTGGPTNESREASAAPATSASVRANASRRDRPAPAVGIDLGTTYSCVTFLDNDGRPTTLLNEEGDATTPSAVFFDRTGPVVGREALKAAEFEPHRIARFAKRDMGESAYRRKICGEQFPPEVIQSLILRKLKRDAELQLGEIRQAVVTVPAYFNEPRRKATQDAGRLAGLEVLDIINEPTAAAVAYGVKQGFISGAGTTEQREIVLVYDLGGGTFDVTLMDIRGGRYRALATGGDVYLGGIDWDERIAAYVADRFRQQHGVDLRQDAAAWERLLHEAVEAKRSLTARDAVVIPVIHDGRRLRLTMTRSEFESLTADLLERTRMTVRKLIQEARLRWDRVTRLLLVGGATRMPMVRNMLETESGLKVDRSLSPDEAVSHGAAIYAGILLNRGGDRLRGISVQNVNSHDLGVLAIERATGRQRRRLMIARNTPLPASAQGAFRTARSGQTNVLVSVVEGGTESGAHATHIGQCIVKDLPADLPARTPVTVTFQYGQNGRLTVRASLPNATRQAKLVIERASGLSRDDLDRWQSRLDGGIRLDHEDRTTGSGTQRSDADAKPEETPSKRLPKRAAVVSSADSIAVEDIDVGAPQPEVVAPDDTSLADFLKGLG